MSQVHGHTDKQYIPRPKTLTSSYLRDILADFCMTAWNGNKDAVAAVSGWMDLPLVVRMPDVKQDFTVHIDNGVVTSVSVGLPDHPRMLSVVPAEIMMRIYYDETTAAIESIAGRIRVRGKEMERRRLLEAMSYLTW